MRSARWIGWFLGLALCLCALAGVPSIATAAEASSSTQLIPTVTVRARQDGVGWLAPVDDGGPSGGSGNGQALTDLELTLDAGPAGSGTLVYQLADADGAWGPERASGEVASAGSKGVGGLRAWLDGDIAGRFDLRYQVSHPAIGWLGWASNGQEAGAFGIGGPIEAVRVELVPKGTAPRPSEIADPILEPATLSFSGFISGQGDTGAVPGGSVFGDPAWALHDFKVSLGGWHRPRGSVTYHVNTGSWRDWVGDGASACPVDPYAPVQAIEIRLDGALATCYDVWYRTHPFGMDWLGWTSNGGSAGTSGLGRYLCQVQVTLLPKGSPAPGSTETPYLTRVPMGTVLGNIAGAPGGLAGFGGVGFNGGSPEGQRLQNAINRLTSGGRQLGFVMVDIDSGRGVVFNGNQNIYVASSIKGPYVFSINKYLPEQVSPWVRSTMAECISISCNDCYARLRSTFGPGPIASLQAYVGGCSFPTNVNYPWICAKDLAKLWVGGYEYFFRDTNANSEWCRGLYTGTINSFIRQAVGWKATCYTKPGWIASGPSYIARNDAGIVMDGDHPYVLAVLSTAYGRDGDLAELVNALDAYHATIVAW